MNYGSANKKFKHQERALLANNIALVGRTLLSAAFDFDFRGEN
jgi:hypothetical protein